MTCLSDGRSPARRGLPRVSRGQLESQSPVLLVAVAAHGVVIQACRLDGIAPGSIHRWLPGCRDETSPPVSAQPRDRETSSLGVDLFDRFEHGFAGPVVPHALLVLKPGGPYGGCPGTEVARTDRSGEQVWVSRPHTRGTEPARRSPKLAKGGKDRLTRPMAPLFVLSRLQPCCCEGGTPAPEVRVTKCCLHQWWTKASGGGEGQLMPFPSEASDVKKDAFARPFGVARRRRLDLGRLQSTTPVTEELVGSGDHSAEAQIAQSPN
jgi:hypothetical protein